MKGRWRVQRWQTTKREEDLTKKWLKTLPLFHQDITDRQKPWSHCILGSAVPRRMKTLKNGGMHQDAAANGSHDLFVRRLIIMTECYDVAQYSSTWVPRSEWSSHSERAIKQDGHNIKKAMTANIQRLLPRGWWRNCQEFVRSTRRHHKEWIYSTTTIFMKVMTNEVERRAKNDSSRSQCL